MQSINFDTGIKKYAVNGDENNVININVSDVNIIKRFRESLPKIEKLREKYSSETVEDVIEADAEIRILLNEAFGTDICTPAFGSTNCLSMVNGVPLFERFFTAFMPILEADIKANAPKTAKQPEIRPEVKKYIEPVKPVAALAQPYGIDVSTLTKEQKSALLAQLIS